MPIRVRSRVVAGAEDAAATGAGHDGRLPHGRPSPRRRPVTRLRLTCVYGGVFMTAGTVLLAVVHLLAVQAVSRGSEPVLNMGPGTSVVLVTTACPPPRDTAPAPCPAPRRQQPRDPLTASTLLVLAALGPLSIAAGYVTAGCALSPVRRMTLDARRACRQDAP
ncbi:MULTISPECIES: hypothetical protein [unclassified Streptomyces]|uniref:hypothetical protein n=1 Tax=unclassified Streptomyces TaxID=2593676 RepID=UPI0038069113